MFEEALRERRGMLLAHARKATCLFGNAVRLRAESKKRRETNDYPREKFFRNL
jgi:hypothetical protein